jgi:hypothetical protein
MFVLLFTEMNACNNHKKITLQITKFSLFKDISRTKDLKNEMTSC